DLFGEGIYVGKGIYDAEAFERSLSGRVPENALLSHDLFEGLQGRAALASDIVLYEGFPTRYTEFGRRLHRWVRGDWQILPWLADRVPGESGRRLPNLLSRLDRWRIVDNLRRSLMAPALVALLAAGWLSLSGSPWVWTTLALCAPAGYLFTDLVTGLARGRRRGAVRGTLRRLVDHAGRWFLSIVFLPHDAAIAVDAIIRTLWRLFVSHRHLLMWTSAAHATERIAGPGSRMLIWRQLWTGPIASIALTIAISLIRPSALPCAAPLLLLWFASPGIAERMSRPRQFRPEILGVEERAFLRRIARRTWFFFETFTGPDDHWLPPDNFQEDPDRGIAHRTSPTNIGMMFLSSLTAWDFGYAGSADFTARVRNSLESLERIERYRGHLYNWYDTRSQEPLEPRYVSTADSGNLAVSLLTLKEGCLELAESPALRRELWDGLADALSLLTLALARSPVSSEGEAPRARVAAIAKQVSKAREDPPVWQATLTRLCEHDCPELDRMLMAAIALPGSSRPEALSEIRTWLERIHHHLRGMQREFETLVPWIALTEAPPAGCEGLARSLATLLPPTLGLKETEERCHRARELCAHAALAGGEDGPAQAWIEALDAAIERGAVAARELHGSLLDAAERAESLALAMDFRFLFDEESRLFHIGYNVSADRLDPHHYDFLATEARLASFFAIAKGDAPLAHWFFLGRPITKAGGRLSLLSWGGSMFEYLMPSLLLRSHPGTLLAQSERAAVEAQRRRAEKLGIPWGMSESGFASFGPDGHYAYRAFGVPELGIHRGLSRDLVVAPYATALALPIHAKASIQNLRELESLGLSGLYGLFEAADFTPERVPEGQRFSPVRSYMAHHQGMILAAIGNALHGDALVRRFHADRRIRAVELLLDERIPRELPEELIRTEERREPAPRQPVVPAPVPWIPVGSESFPQVHALGNGRLSTWISEAGAGALRWHDHALTRWLPDATRDDHGLWIYIRDEESGAVWSAGRQPTGV
ncbi:MAG: glucoamylase family protein, partial [Deltaproteobacteria bacterium]|nr:glucoamylase family protein [Deltaproteobacteria bacterium]